MSALTAPVFEMPALPDYSPDVEYDVRTDVWTLKEDWTYHDAQLGLTLLVRAGFPFDLASIPRPLQGIIPKYRLSIAAPLGHDALYQRGGDTGIPGQRRYSREEADDLFRRLMAEAGVPKLRRVAAWLAVRLFGGRAWRSAAAA